MNKRDFILQYVMNRALAVEGILIPRDSVQAAAAAWDELQRVAPATGRNPPIDLDAAKRSIGGR